MGLLATLRRNRAARRYARELAPWLERSYGASDSYAPPQIRAGVKELKLDPAFIAIGYAAFLPEEEFDALRPETADRLAYAEARALFERFRPPMRFSVSGPPEVSYQATGWPDSLGGTGHHQ